MTIQRRLSLALFCITNIRYSLQSTGQREDEKYSAENETQQIVDILSNYLKDYNQFEVPLKRPLPVGLHFHIMRISDINELNMDFTLSYFLQMTWRDDRLRFRPEHFGNISRIILHPNQIHTIWRPDIMYINEKGESMSKPFSLSNSASRVYPSGEVYLVRKLETKFQCQMKLQNYPFDTQMCYMVMGSFTFTADLMKFEYFKSPPVDFHSDIEMTSFELLQVNIEESNVTAKSGTFHTLKIIFKLRRFINFYIIQVNIFLVIKE